MSHIGRWILAVASLCFLAGVTVGFATARFTAPRPPANKLLEARWGTYVDRLAAECGLARDQVEVLWEILRQHEEALQDLQDHLVLSPDQQAQRLDLARKTNSLVTKLVASDPRQWQRYQAAAMPLLMNPGPVEPAGR
jgi:hypothetical protein